VSKRKRFSFWRSRLYPVGSPFRKVRSPTRCPWSRPAFPRTSSATSGFRFCERGIRTFETATRNTFDVSAIPILKKETHLPVIADPSHAGGRRDLVAPLGFAAVAAGADGLIVEVHPRPEEALSDGEQTLDFDQFASFMTRLAPFAEAAGRRLT
jgi:3-deoxy-7-phosphoheptulonate synthase